MAAGQSTEAKIAAARVLNALRTCARKNWKLSVPCSIVTSASDPLKLSTSVSFFYPGVPSRFFPFLQHHGSNLYWHIHFRISTMKRTWGSSSRKNSFYRNAGNCLFYKRIVARPIWWCNWMKLRADGRGKSNSVICTFVTWRQRFSQSRWCNSRLYL